jgi:hypothetical protein
MVASFLIYKQGSVMRGQWSKNKAGDMITPQSAMRNLPSRIRLDLLPPKRDRKRARRGLRILGGGGKVMKNSSITKHKCQSTKTKRPWEEPMAFVFVSFKHLWRLRKGGMRSSDLISQI